MINLNIKFTPELEEKLKKYVLYIDGRLGEITEKTRKEMHNEIFNFLNVKRHSKNSQEVEDLINKWVRATSENNQTKIIAELNLCKTQEEIDNFKRKLEFLKKYMRDN